MSKKFGTDKQDMLAQIYELYEQKMFSAAYAILHSTEQAEDAVQNCFVKLISYLPKIDRPDSIKTKALVYRVLKTTAIDQYRKNSNGKEYLTDDVSYESNAHFKIVSMPDVEEKEFLQKLFYELPEDYLEVVKLRCYYGFSARETAEILNISESNVCKRLERARKHIQEKLDEEEEESVYERQKYRSHFRKTGKRSTGKAI